MHLFYSFNTLLLRLMEGRVLPVDLGRGLFALQVGRSLVFCTDRDNPSVLPILEAGPYGTAEKQEAVFKLWVETVQPAVLKAEQEERVIWREGEERILPYTRLASFLKGHGFGVPDQMPWTHPASTPSAGDIERFLAVHAPDLHFIG